MGAVKDGLAQAATQRGRDSDKLDQRSWGGGNGAHSATTRVLPAWLYRPFAVPDRLDELDGPSSGSIELPTRIAWRGRTVFDLGVEEDVVVVAYSAVLAHGSAADVQQWVNADLVQAVLCRLRVPRLVHAEWDRVLRLLHT